MDARRTETKSPTKEMLLERGVDLFSKNGYDGTTTRMIADACGVNVATIAFHYRNKEGFYVAVMNHAAQEMEAYFKPFDTKVEEYLAGTTIEEMTWALIDEFFDLIINVVRDEKRHATLYLLIREQTDPPAGDYPLTRVVYRQSERIIVSLIKQLQPNIDDALVAIHSRLIIGGLISQAEHPIFLRRALGLPDDAPLSDHVWEEVKRFAISAVRFVIE